MAKFDISPYIDHSLLNPWATQEQIKECCNQADQLGFPVVTIYPIAIKQAAELLHGRRCKVNAVIGFPTGAVTSATKLQSALEATEAGAEELDVMINLGWIKEGRSEDVYQEMAQICEDTGAIVKAVLEMNVLTTTEKRLAAEICMDAGASFLKTNTGWFGGVKVEDVRLLHQIVQGRIGIKAAGGIHTLEQAWELVEAGATRLGTSYGLAMMEELKSPIAKPDESPTN